MSERQQTTQTLKISEARQQFSQLLNKVFRGEARIVVEKSSIPVAAIISASDLDALTRLEREREETSRPSMQPARGSGTCQMRNSNAR